MYRKLMLYAMIILFLSACTGGDGSRNDRMKEWGTKRSTAVPMKDFPGGPPDGKWENRKK